jgi:hypothetical protein
MSDYRSDAATDLLVSNRLNVFSASRRSDQRARADGAEMFKMFK